MRPETRLVLSWLIGRPNGWEVRVGQMISVLGLSRERWSRARREMQRWGYLKQTRNRKPDGSFEWEIVVTDTPTEIISPSDGSGQPARQPCDQTRQAPSGESGLSNEVTIAGFPGNGGSVDGKPSDITTPLHQQDLNTPLVPPISITQACFEEAQRRFSGYSIEHLEERWRAWVNDRGEVPKRLDSAFLAWAAGYVRNHQLPNGGTF